MFLLGGSRGVLAGLEVAVSRCCFFCGLVFRIFEVGRVVGIYSGSSFV